MESDHKKENCIQTATRLILKLNLKNIYIYSHNLKFCWRQMFNSMSPTWNTVIMAAAKVSKLVGGVPSSKLNLEKKKITCNESYQNTVQVSKHEFWSLRWYLLSTKQLHPQQGKDHDEEEEEEKQTDNGFHGVQQRNHQVSERSPVPEVDKGKWKRKKDNTVNGRARKCHLKLF